MYLLWLLYFDCLVLLFLSGLGKANIVIYDGDHDVQVFSDIELPFAQPILNSRIQGVIVAAIPLHACSNISGPPDVNSSLNWFVLISGNSCDYNTKVVYSELAGYSAAVIYSFRGKDDAPYRQLYTQISTKIPAVVIKTRSGLIIKEKYLYTVDKRYRIFIYPNNFFNIMTFLLLFAIVAGIFIAIMLSFMIVRFVQQARSVHNNRLSSRHLRQLQTSRFQTGDPYETCAICLEDYKDRDKLRILPCFHGYHAKCIDPWLTKNRRICPVCKQKVVLASEFSEIDTESDAEASRGETTPLLSSASGWHVPHGTFADTDLSTNTNPDFGSISHDNVQNLSHSDQNSQST